MIRLIKPFVALLFLAACASPERAPTAAQMAAAETSAAALVEEWARAGSEGRWDDVAALYADEPGFAWIEQGENRYADRAAIEAGIAQVRASQLQVHTVVSDVVATALSPDAAAVRAHYSIVFGDPAQGGYSFDGMLTGVAVERDARWVFLQGHLSSPPPRAANPPE
ncbi:MAG: nuclear transport factor 2 family protein [Hyphomonadaceae bacterium]